MSRVLQYVNLAGVCALAVLCAAQWKQNSRLNLEAANLERVKHEQAIKISEQDKTLSADSAEMEDLRKALAESEEAIKTTTAKLAAETTANQRLATERDQLAMEREQLKSALEKWGDAVKQRDDALKRAGEEIQKLAKERNDAIGRFNDLANRYNAVVKELNAARSK